MILFKSDWERFPTAIVDYQTSNESFKRLVYLYKQMGIDNAEFILALYQPELVGVDPFDPNLSRDMKMRVALECQYNPWYYFREVARVPPNAGTVPVKFKANRGNIAAYWSFFNHIDFGLLQPRQTGKSVSTDVLMTGIVNLWASNTTINLITKDLALRNNNVERLKEIRNLLPDYIYYPNRLDADNSELITNLKRGNRYKTSVGRNDKIAADKLGRGLTVPIMHFDELAYINLVEISLPVALSSGSAARDEAKEANQPYGNIYTTTAGNINSRDGAFAYKFMTGGAVWDEHYFDLPDQPTLAKVVDKNSTGLKPLIYGAFNHRQLGRTDEWLYGKLRESASEGELADRDYFNIWTTGTEGTPLNAEEKAALKSSEREVEHMEISGEGYALRWYVPHHQIEARMASGFYIIGSDPSEALGADNDATTLVITDAYTHDVVCTGRYNETNLTTFAMWLVKLLVRFPNTVFIPERKSSGKGILDTLMIQLPLHGIDPFKRIYNRIVDEPETYKTEFKEIQRPVNSRPVYFYDKYMRYFGYNTSGSGKHARDNLYGDALKGALRLGGKRVHDKTLIGELLSLTIRNGRIDHSAGNHDDMVIAYLLTHWFCTKARNLDYYGIDQLKVFSAAVVNVEEMTTKERYQQGIKQQNLEVFNDLIAQLKDAQDPMIINKLEIKIRQMSSKVDLQDAGGVGIDAMIRQAQEERNRRSKLKRFNRPGGSYGRQFGGQRM
jgi:hypothetical protein